MKRYKTYYGEFSLREWIKMLLNGDVVLPPFQRSFVWKEEQVKGLLESFSEGFMIPPVIIAKKGQENIILDGQQRLSSILLSFIQLFPKKTQELFADMQNDLEGDDEDIQSSGMNQILDWRLNSIQEKFHQCNSDIQKTIEELQKDSMNYRSFDGALEESSFWDENFLGYAYVTPREAAINTSTRDFAKTFHQINTAGTPLLPYESRQAYYWLDEKLGRIFAPLFATNIKIVQNQKLVKVDFVRPLAFAVEYFHAHDDLDKIRPVDVAKGYSRNLESYFTDFVQCAADFGDNLDGLRTRFGNVREILGNNVHKRLERLEKLCTVPKFLSHFDSLYVYDYYFFGLVYWTMVSGKDIRKEDLPQIKADLQGAIEKFKESVTGKTNYNTLQRIRERLHKSISIYENYVNGDIANV